MKAQDLKVGSKIEIEIFTLNSNGELMTESIVVSIDRCSDTYLWFKSSGYQRIGRTTIDKNPNRYRIVSI